MNRVIIETRTACERYSNNNRNQRDFNQGFKEQRYDQRVNNNTNNFCPKHRRWRKGPSTVVSILVTRV